MADCAHEPIRIAQRELDQEGKKRERWVHSVSQ
jgi:hypothetical protein